MSVDGSVCMCVCMCVSRDGRIFYWPGTRKSSVESTMCAFTLKTSGRRTLSSITSKRTHIHINTCNHNNINKYKNNL